MLCPIALIGFFDPRALGPVPLLDLALPPLDDLFRDDRVIKSPVSAFHETPQRAAAMLLPSARITPQTDQSHEHGVVVGKAPGGDLVPGGGPEQHGVPAGLGMLLGRQIAIAQARDVQRHEREVLKVRVGRGEGSGSGHRRPSRMVRPPNSNWSRQGGVNPS